MPTCSINPILSCGSVMKTAQAEAFGFPNPIIGVAGFTVVLTTGAALLAGATFRRWFWLGLQAGVTFGIGFVHWLIFQSLYRIDALCPYCMVVWIVTIPIFLFVTLRNLRGGSDSGCSPGWSPQRVRPRPAHGVVSRCHDADRNPLLGLLADADSLTAVAARLTKLFATTRCRRFSVWTRRPLSAKPSKGPMAVGSWSYSPF